MITGIPLRSRRMAQYQMDRLGDPATLTQFTPSTPDAYGDDTYTEQVDEITVIISTVTNTRLPFERRGELGHYYVMQVEFFCMDDVAIPNTAVGKPPNLLHKGLKYEIIEIEDSQIGLLRLIGYRRREE